MGNPQDPVCRSDLKVSTQSCIRQLHAGSPCGRLPKMLGAVWQAVAWDSQASRRAPQNRSRSQHGHSSQQVCASESHFLSVRHPCICVAHGNLACTTILRVWCHTRCHTQAFRQRHRRPYHLQTPGRPQQRSLHRLATVARRATWQCASEAARRTRSEATPAAARTPRVRRHQAASRCRSWTWSRRTRQMEAPAALPAAAAAATPAAPRARTPRQKTWQPL